MSFLAPLFLAGAALIALPILFHLIRRTAKEKRFFSSLLFLSPSPPRVTKRSRIDNLLLLALRCLAICLLALAFARPYLKMPTPLPPSAAQRNIVLLLDRSASMQQNGLWPKAVQEGTQIVEGLRGADRLAIYSFDRSIAPLLTFTEWDNLPPGGREGAATARLRQLTPGWSGTHLGNSIISAVEQLHDPKEPNQNLKVVVVSDFQEGARLDGLQGYQWPRGVKFQLRFLQAQNRNNAGLALLSEGTAAHQKVRVINSAKSKTDRFQLLSLSTPSVPPVEVYVPAGQSRTVTLPPTLLSNDPVALTLKGDDNSFDNEVRWLVPPGNKIRIAHIGSTNSTDPADSAYYVQRAFQKIDRYEFNIQSFESAELPRQDKFDLVLFTGVLTPGASEGLRAIAARGIPVLVALSENPAGLAALVGNPAVRVEEIKHDRYGMLEWINFQHPLFEPFSDPRFSDFTKISFWKNRRILGLPEEAKVLARFDNKDAALVEVGSGTGKILILSTTWKPVDSQFALSSKFVPFLFSILQYNGSLRRSSASWLVGDPVPVPETITSILMPDQSTLAATYREGKVFRPPVPGFYTLLPAKDRVAVNVPPEETRTASIEYDALKQLGLPLQETHAETKTAKAQLIAAGTELESRQKLWQWIIVGVLAILFLETFLAGRLGHRVASTA